MESFKKWFQEMKDLETDKVRSRMNQDFGPYLLRASCTLPDLEHPTLLIVQALLILPLSFFQTVFLAYSTFIVIEEYGTFIYVFHFTVLNVLSFILLIHLNLQRGDMCEFFTRMYDGIFDYEEEPFPELKSIEERLNKKKNYMLALPAAIFLVLVTVLIRPQIDELIGATPHNVYSKHGVNMRTMLPTYYPFPTHEGVMFMFAVATQGISTCVVALTIGTSNFLFLNAVSTIYLQLQLLILSLRNLESRAMVLYKKRFGVEADENKKKEKQFHDCLDFCLIQNVKHHQAIRSLFDLYNGIAALPLSSSFGLATLMIALSLIDLAESKEREFRAQNITFALSVLCEVLNMFLLSYYGEMVTSLSEELFYEVFFIKWHKYHMGFRKILVSLQDGSRKIMLLTGLGSMGCRMETFSWVMNTAYSAFNLLNLSTKLNVIRERYKLRRTRKKLRELFNRIKH